MTEKYEQNNYTYFKYSKTNNLSEFSFVYTYYSDRVVVVYVSVWEV